MATIINDNQIPQLQLTDDKKILVFRPFLVASSTKYETLLICPVDEGIVIESAVACWVTAAGTSGTCDLMKVASGTAGSSATSILTATVNIAGTADTHTAFALDPTKNFVPAGSRLIAKIIHGGTVSEGLTIQVRYTKISPDNNLKG